MAAVRGADLAANWVMIDLAGHLNKEENPNGSALVTRGQLGAIIDLIGDEGIYG